VSENDKTCSDYDLHAYADGELDAQRRLEVEAWLASNPDAAGRLRDYRLIQARLHDRFDAVLTEAVEAPSLPGRFRSGRPGRVAMVAALMLVSVLSGWLLRGTLQESPSRLVLVDLVQPAAFAHQVYSTDMRYPVEIPAREQASLNLWLSQRMHTSLRAPDLSRENLRLIGGRLLPSTNRMAAQFMYEDVQGDRLTVYVRRIADPDGASEFQYREQDDLHVFYWVDGEMGYAVIGTQPASRLVTVASAVQAAFSNAARNGG